MTETGDRLPLTAKAGLSAIGIAGDIAPFLLPLVIGGLVDHYGYTISRASFVAFGDMFGLGVGTLLWAAVISRANWRGTAMGAMAVVVAMNVASALTTHYQLLFALRFLAGVGAGTLLAIANSGLSHARDPDRTVGLYMFVVLLFAALAYYVFPRLIEAWGMAWYFLTVAGISVILGLGSVWIPGHIEPVRLEEEETMHDPAAPVAVWIRVCGALGVFFWFFSASLVLAYIERIARKAGLTTEQIAGSLSLSQLMGAIGGLSAALLSTKLGNRSVPILITTILAMSCCGVLLTDFSVFAFTYAVCALIFGWDAIYPYVVGQLKALDRTARLVSISITMMAAGKAFSPLYGGFVLDGSDYDIISWSGLIAFALGLVFFAPSLMVSDRMLHKGAATDTSVSAGNDEKSKTEPLDYQG